MTNSSSKVIPLKAPAKPIDVVTSEIFTGPVLDGERIGNARLSIMDITPQNAQVLLERRRAGHSINPQAVKIYAEAMKEGNWVFNGMPIIFGSEGSLLDGVQRLQACVTSETAFRTLVADNIREDTLHTIDQHRRRSYNGVLESRGEEHAGTMMRMMSKLIRYENGTVGMPDTQIPWMRYDLVLDSNPLIREAAALSVEQRGIMLKSTARHVLIYMALAAGHRRELFRFLDMLRVPEAYSADEAGYVLAMQMQIARQARNELPLDEMLGNAILAFNDSLHGRASRKGYNWHPDMGPIELDRDGRPVSRAELRVTAPPNLGMPKMEGYPGLIGASYATKLEIGANPLRTALETAHAVSNPGDKRNVSDLMKLHQPRPITVDPATAQDWLDNLNTRNRRILDHHVKTIERDIRAGNWMFNAQPLCFSVERKLLNGQHRLKACVMAGEPIDVIIIENIPVNAFATYDIHARKVAPVDLGETEHRVDMRVVSAAAKLQWVFDEAEAGRMATTRPSATEIKNTIKQHEGLLRAYGRARRMSEIASAGIMNFIVYRVQTERPDLSEDFLDQLETGAGIEKGNPLLKTRNQILMERNAPRGYSRKRFMNLILSCWDDYKDWMDDPTSYSRKKRAAAKDAAETPSIADMFSDDD